MHHDCRDIAMAFRLGTDRIGCRSISGQREGLTTAAAKILFLFIATAAGFLHPVIAPVFVEGVAALPDLFNAVVGDVGVGDAGQAAGSVAGECSAVGTDGQKHRAPAIHASLGPLFEIVGHHEQDFHLVADAAAVIIDYGFGLLDLFTGRHQMGAIDHAPAVVLGVRQFQILDLHRQRHFDDAGDMVEVVAMQYDIEHHGIVVALDQAGNARFEVEGSGARQEVIHFLGRILKR